MSDLDCILSELNDWLVNQRLEIELKHCPENVKFKKEFQRDLIQVMKSLKEKIFG